MSSKYRRWKQRQDAIPRWNGVTRRQAKGKSNSYGAGRRLVPLETVFSTPGWTKYQY